MLTTFLNWISNYISFFPLIAFIGLILGGFNLPISEDVLVAMSAILCQDEKSSIAVFLFALYFGAILSDSLVYFWGRLIGKGSLSIKLFSKIITKEHTDLLLRALERYGIFTYIFCRFVPFGVRNIVSMSSGFVNYKFWKFVLYDTVAAICNISVLFWLVYFFGSNGSHWMKITGIFLFVVFLFVSIYLVKSGKLVKFAEKKLD